MPKIPMDHRTRPDSTPALGAGLPPEAAEGLRGLERMNQRIEREILAASYLLDGMRELREGARDRGAADPQFFGSFRQSTERRMFQTLTAAPESVRSVLREDLSVLGAALKDKSMTLEGEARAVQRRVRLGALFETFAEIVRNDPTQIEAVLSRATAVFGDMALPEDRRAEIRRHVRDLIGNAALDGLLDDPADAQGLLNAGDFDALLTPESLASRKAQVSGEMQRAQILAKERTMIELSEAADTGGLTGKGIDDAVRAGTLTKLEADFLRAKNDDALAAAAREKALLDRVPAKNGRFDPASPEDQETIDALWKVAGEQISTGKPDEQASREVRFVRNRGVLPTALRNKYSGLLYSADPALQVAGARAFAALEKIDPRLIEKFPPEVQDRARAIGNFAEIPLAPDLVVSLAEDELAKSNQAEVAGEFPEEAEATPLPENTAEDIEEPASAEKAAPGRNVTSDTQGVTRPIRTSKQFVGLLEDTFGMPETVIDQRAREAGFSPDSFRIALSLVSASDGSAAGRAEILERARRDIESLPNKRGIPKEQMRKLVDGIGPVLGDRDKTLQAIAANQEAFRDRFSQNRDPDTQFREVAVSFAQKTEFEARPVADFTAAEGGLDPKDPRNDIGEELPIESGVDRPIKNPRIAFFRKGSAAPFMTLPHSAALAVMRDPENVAERLEFVARWRSGTLSSDELDKAAKSFLGEGGDHRAFVTADVLMRQSKHKDAILSAFIPVLIPEATGEANVWLHLLDDVLPVIGEVKAIREAGKDFEKLQEAIRDGDIKRAIGFGLLTTLDAAGAVPIFGSLFRASRGLVRSIVQHPDVARALRDTKGVNVVHSRLTLARRLDKGFPKTRQELLRVTRSGTLQEVFGDVLPQLNRSQQSLLRGLFPHMKKNATEGELLTLSDTAGFTNLTPQNSRTVMVGQIVHKNGIRSIEEKKRIFDNVTKEGFGIFLNIIVFPRRGGKGTASEFKGDGAQKTVPQDVKDKRIEADLAAGKEVRTGTNPKNPTKKNLKEEKIAIEAIKLFRQPVFKVPVNEWTEIIEDLLRPHTVTAPGSNRALLSDKDVAVLVAAGKRWHEIAGKEKQNPIDVADLVILLAFMTRQLVEDSEIKKSFSISDEQQKEIDRRIGKGVEESLNQPFGS
ncbi:MAG: hypothetical protein OEU46_17650 [Alphaproteobacteria bacterium]|nr:hypothetical protein [Alphaproteobacteria bacterium]